jgi:hypothetical protein
MKQPDALKILLRLALAASLLGQPAVILSAQDVRQGEQPFRQPLPSDPIDVPADAPVDAPGDAPRAQPPEGFRSIRLGMELEVVKELLQKDPLFAYRGDPDVSLLPQPQQTLIECEGTSYIRRAFLQFHERRLYILILALDPQRLDYYTMYSTLSGKYGEPDRLDPSEAVWEFEGLRLSLERPLSVKYIDTEVFDKLQDEAQAGEDLRALARDQFLEQF